MIRSAGDRFSVDVPRSHRKGRLQRVTVRIRTADAGAPDRTDWQRLFDNLHRLGSKRDAR